MQAEKSSSAAPAATAASGYVEATDVRVAAKVAGRVATVTVNEGQTVQAGQTLVTEPGERIRYGVGPDGAEYLAICLPAFTPESVHREDE